MGDLEIIKRRFLQLLHDLGLMQMQFNEFRLLDWTCADGRKMPIKDLENSHVANIINHIIKSPPGWYEPNREWLIAMFHNEAEYRGLSLEYLDQDHPFRDPVDGKMKFFSFKTLKYENIC